MRPNGRQCVDRACCGTTIHSHRWFPAPGCGQPRKADAIDHHDDHGLVGCQDIAWDVAGAAIELDLDAARTAALCAAIAERGVPSPDRDLVAFYRPCYAASRMAADRLAAGTSANAAEADRLGDRAARYTAILASALGL